MTTATRHGDLQQPGRAQPTAKSRIGLIVALSMVAGLIAAVVLVAMPFIPARENVFTGVVLLAFALGWALLAVLSTRFSDQPQRWAAAPAMFMAVAGLVSLSGSAAVQAGFSWVWPPVLFGLVVWMFLRVRRDMRSRIGRWLLYPVLAVLMIASVGGGYQTVRESLDAKAYPPPGQLIDVGGHRLHLYCTGSGSPTVVLEPGRRRVLLRLRRGLRRPWPATPESACMTAPVAAGATQRTARRTVPTLPRTCTRCFERAQVPGPYVLAGHSFGGLYVQSFAAQFPDQVAGMVLLDSTAPKPGPAQPTNTDPYNLIGRVAALSAASAHLGAGRLLNPISYTTLPPRSRDEARANSSTASHLASFVEEYGVANTSMQQASALTSLNGKPLIVLTADEGADDQWQSKQDHMATLSTNSLHRHANATHASLLDDEADAAVASKAIHDVVVAVRTSRPLAPR